IASKPAPTLISGAHGIGVHRHPLWELSLLAIAVGQAALKLNVPPSSRASSAPTLISGAHGIGVHRHPCGSRACSR
ncbi:hypothetical protein CVG87_24840, partial [Pseudomonas sp. WCS365]